MHEESLNGLIIAVTETFEQQIEIFMVPGCVYCYESCTFNVRCKSTPPSCKIVTETREAGCLIMHQMPFGFCLLF